MRRPWIHILQTGSASAVSICSSAIILAATARWLGPEGRGVYAAAVSWVMLCSTVGSFSFGQAIVHKIAGRSARTWLPSAVGTSLILLAAVLVLDYSALAVAYFVTDGQLFRHLDAGVLILAFAALPFIIANSNLPFVLYALDGLHTVNVAMAVGAVVGLVSTIVLVGPLNYGVAGALVAFGIGAACTTVIGGAGVLRHAAYLETDRALAAELLTGGGKLYLNTVGTYLFTQSSVLILNQFRPTAETGQYQFAIQLFTVSLVMSNSMGTVSYGLVSTLGPDVAWPAQRRLTIQALLLIMCGIPVAYVLAPILIPLVAGEAFAPSVGLFRWLLPALVGATLSSLMASQWIARGMFWQISAITIATGVISVGLDLALIPIYGMYGALVSTLVTYGISCLVNVAMALWVNARVAKRNRVADV